MGWKVFSFSADNCGRGAALVFFFFPELFKKKKNRISPHGSVRSVPKIMQWLIDKTNDVGKRLACGRVPPVFQGSGCSPEPVDAGGTLMQQTNAYEIGTDAARVLTSDIWQA